MLARELHKSGFNRFKIKIIYVRLKYNIWAADLTEIRLLSSFNQNVKYLLCVIDVFNNAWFKPLKNKKS